MPFASSRAATAISPLSRLLRLPAREDPARRRRRRGQARGARVGRARRATTLADALNDFAWELGGSDDIHATARYRREMVRRLGQEGDRGGAPMRFLKQRRAPSRPLHAQRRAGRGLRRAAHAAHRFHAPRDRRDRHACGLRARHLRRVHHSRRRQGGARLPDARGAGGGQDASRRSKGSRRRTRRSRPCSSHSIATSLCNAVTARPAS